MPVLEFRSASSQAITQTATQRQAPFSTIAPLLGAALLLGVGGGFALASMLTLTRALHATLGPWWAALAQAHGHLQLYGWAGCFMLGVALHFVPRLRGAPLPCARALPWIVAVQVTGLLLRTAAQPLVAHSGTVVWRICLLASGILEALALGSILALFAAVVWRGQALRSRSALWSVLPLFALAYGALAVAAAVNVLNVTGAALGAPAGLIPTSGDNVNVMLGLLGVLVPMALAMSARSLPMYAGLNPFPQRILWPAAAVYLLGLLLSIADALASTQPSRLTGLGLTLIGSVLLLFVIVFARMIRARGQLPTRIQRLAPAAETAARSYQVTVASERAAYGPYVGLVASAYLWALVGGMLLVLDGLALLLGAIPPVARDAERHTLALGFIALLICGIAPRMVPGFSGGRLASPRLVTATLWLGNAAVLLRVGPVLAMPLLAGLGAGGVTLAEAAFGLSGPLGLALALCLAINLWPAIYPHRRPPSSLPARP